MVLYVNTIKNMIGANEEGTAIRRAMDLALLLTGSQLSRLAKNMGIKVSMKHGKALAAARIYEAASRAAAAGVEKSSGGAEVGESAAPEARTAARGRPPRATCTLDPEKVQAALAGGKLPGLLRTVLEAMVAARTYEVSAAAVAALGVAAPRGGNLWRNVCWYKSRGYLREMVA